MEHSLFLNALHGKNTARAPIWLMRQAGRYMPDYQKYRKHHSLFDLFHDVEKIVAITQLPVTLLHVDAAILFSDILSLCDGLGVPWGFEEGKGPLLPEPVLPSWRFRKQEPEQAYGHIQKAIRLLKKELKVPLIGFAGAPFTVASYLIEGGSSRQLQKTKKWLYTDSPSFETLLNEIAEETIAYLRCQVEAGVDAIQLFDSWAHTLDTPSFRKYSLQMMEKIVKAFAHTPIILFCRGSCFFAPLLASLRPHALSLDWSGEIALLRGQLPREVALQGNLDPMVLYGTRERIQQEADRLLDAMEGDPGYIFNLGHGVLPDIPFDNVRTLVDHVLSR